MGGRGAGKTRAGAEWIRSMAEGAKPEDPGKVSRIALVGETYDQARDVMVHGESGILACSPPDRRPDWVSSRRQLVWPNGAVAQVYSAMDAEALRGPQFDCAWMDELAKWKEGQKAWDMLQFCLRLGDDPRQLITTTPRNVGVLKRIIDAPSTVMTHAPTQANRANLARGFLEEVEARYAGTRLGRQELAGEFLTSVDGALWSLGQFETRATADQEFDRIVVAVDPPVSHHAGSDACGIIVAGVQTSGAVGEWHATILADLTLHAASPNGWAQVAIDAYYRFGADRIVAETNQGGAMVETILRSLDPGIPFKSVHASRGKSARAEPVAALYEQGRVRHVAGLDPLEDQMCEMTHRGYVGSGSPDRVDALVWAVTELLITPMRHARRPAIRNL